MLLLDDDDELPASPDEDEASLMTELGAIGLATVDDSLRRHAKARWSKVAMVIVTALESDARPLSDASVDLYARRTIELVRRGVFDSQGDLRKPRFSEVRLREGSLVLS